MASGVGQVNLIFSVALVLGIGTCTGRLDNLLRSEVERHVVVGIGQGQTRDGRVPVDATPAEVPVRRVVAKNEGRRIGGILCRTDAFFLAQVCDVARFFRNTVVERRFIGMAAVNDEHAFVGQYEERWVVVVVGLEITANQHVSLFVQQPVVLCRLDISMNIDVANPRHVNCAGLVLVMHRTWVGKPAPRSLFANDGAVIAVSRLSTGTKGTEQADDT